MNLAKKKKTKKQKMGIQANGTDRRLWKNMLSKWLSNLRQRCNNIQWREDMNLYRCCWKILRNKNLRMKLRHSLLLFTGQVIPDCLWCHRLNQASLTMHHHLPEFAQVHIHCIGNDAIKHTHSCHTFSFCLQYFPSSGSFPMCWLFVLDG